MELGFISKIGDVIKMSDTESYMVVDCINYKDGYYLNVLELNSQQKDINDAFKTKYIEEIITQDQKYALREVDDLETKKALFELQKEMER